MKEMLILLLLNEAEKCVDQLTQIRKNLMEEN